MKSAGDRERVKDGLSAFYSGLQGLYGRRPHEESDDRSAHVAATLPDAQQGAPGDP